MDNRLPELKLLELLRSSTSMVAVAVYMSASASTSPSAELIGPSMESSELLKKSLSTEKEFVKSKTN